MNTGRRVWCTITLKATSGTAIQILGIAYFEVIGDDTTIDPDFETGFGCDGFHLELAAACIRLIMYQLILISWIPYNSPFLRIILIFNIVLHLFNPSFIFILGHGFHLV